MGFVYYWLVADMPADRRHRFLLEVEEKLKNGLKEILEKYDVKINREEYIEQCICLLRKRASLGEYKDRCGKSEEPTLNKRRRQYIQEANNKEDKHKYNNAYASVVREHSDKLLWGYFTPSTAKIYGYALCEIESLYIDLFGCVKDEFCFNKINAVKASKYADMTEEQREEINKIYQECLSQRETYERYNEIHLETYFSLSIIRKVLLAKGHDTSVNRKFPNIPLLMCDIETGEIVKSFDSKTLAAKYIYASGLCNNKSIQSIMNCITEAIKRQGTAYDYGWKEKTEDVDEKIIF